MIKKHFDGIVAWTQTRQTNGFLEALNGLFQAAKRKAGGHLGGSAKFGYAIQGTGQAATLVAKPEEQAALAYAKEMRATGISFRAISNILKTSHGVIVSHEAIRRALQGETA